MQYLQKRSLTIIVAHRLETIRSAQKIIVLDQGRVVMDGTHQELIENSSHYREFLDQL